MDPDDDLKAALSPEVLAEVAAIRREQSVAPVLWRWWITDEISGKRRLTSYRMTEADARERFGAGAVKDEGSREVRHRVGSASEVGGSRPH